MNIDTHLVNNKKINFYEDYVVIVWKKNIYAKKKEVYKLCDTQVYTDIKCRKTIGKMVNNEREENLLIFFLDNKNLRKFLVKKIITIRHY